jgi:hypothetical protein
MKTSMIVGFVACLGSVWISGCGAEGDAGVSSEAVEATSQALQGPGTEVTTDFPHVVRVDWGCTGTVIHRRFVLTAFHCGHQGPTVATGREIEFTDVPGIGQKIINFDRAWSAGNLVEGLLDGAGYRWGPDSALLRLTEPAPAAVTPARICKYSPPAGQQVITYGYGAYEADGDGQCNDGDMRKRRREWTFPPSGTYGSGACGGDSGGPTFWGSTPGADLIGTTDTGFGLSSVTQISEELYEQIRLMLPDPVTGKVERWVDGVTREGFDMAGATTAATTADCEKQCIVNNRCRAWSYARSSKVCTLKSNVGRWLPADDVASGLRPEIEPGFHRSGTGSINYAGVGTARMCRAKCDPEDTALCGSFDYEPSTKLCKWYSNNPTPVANGAGVTTISGQPAMGIDVGMVRYASDYRIVDGITAEACRIACAEDYDCMAYAYATGGAMATRCFFKNAYATPYADSIYNTGAKRRPTLPGYYLQGTKISGYDNYVPTPKAGSTARVVDMCASDCQKISSCVAFTARHHQPGKLLTCTLYNNVTSEVAIVDGDDPEVGASWQVTSGYRNEQFN